MDMLTYFAVDAQYNQILPGPRIKAEPKSLLVLSHMAATLQCFSESGSITWFHNGKSVDIVDGYKILANGSLIILSVDEIDVGDYYCEVNTLYVGVIRSQTVNLMIEGKSSISKRTSY